MTRPPSGGAGTHYGLLYQILSSLHRALTISTAGRKDSIVLTVEPTAGGDLTEECTRRRDVYQFKARSSRAAWSLNSVIDDVLPDLYRSVRDGSTTATTYWLVTEGRRGRWDSAWQFFQRLRGMSRESFIE